MISITEYKSAALTYLGLKKVAYDDEKNTRDRDSAGTFALCTYVVRAGRSNLPPADPGSTPP